MTALATIVCTALLDAGEVDVRAELSPPEIPFHESARYSIIVEAPADVDVELPSMVGNLGGLEVIDTTLSSDTRLARVHYLAEEG